MTPILTSNPTCRLPREFTCYPDPVVDCNPDCTCDPDGLLCVGSLPPCLQDWQCRDGWVCGPQQRCVPPYTKPARNETCTGPADVQLRQYCSDTGISRPFRGCHRNEDCPSPLGGSHTWAPSC